MKYTVISLLLVIISINFIACNTETNQLKSEQAYIDSTILKDEMVLPIYTGIKKTLRSIDISERLAEPDSIFSILKKDKKNTKTIKRYLKFLVKKIFYKSKTARFSIIQYYSLLSDFKKLAKDNNAIDEDKFPTILKVISNISTTDETSKIKELKWSNSKEHFLLAYLLKSSSNLPKSLQVYEFSKLENNIENTEIKPLTAILKSLTFLEMEMYYISENTASKSLKELETENIDIKCVNSPSFFNTEKLKDLELQKLQFSAFQTFIRAYTRCKINTRKRKRKANTDFLKFIEDAKKLNLDNELTQFALAYTNIWNKEYKTAKIYIQKLKNSSKLNQKVKFTIIEEYLDKKEQENALYNLIYEIKMSENLYGYLDKYISETSLYQTLNDLETGQMLISVPKLIDSELEKIGFNFK